ncbi:hypothetical protein [Streptomyces sp. NPDC048737]|uniref:hypothetical protein n=1 Tax=unclassified Streptomyces TaxID=2593676 RepID=UPI0034123930
MTHFPSKRSSRPGAAPAAVAGQAFRTAHAAAEEPYATARAPRALPAHRPVPVASLPVPVAPVPVQVAVSPGTRRAEAPVPAGEPNILPQGTGQDRSGTVIVYDTPVAHGVSTGSATVRIAAHGVTARHPALSDDVDGAPHEPNGEQAPAVGRTGGRIVLEDTAFPGDRDTLITDGPGPDVTSRGRVRDSCPGGDVGLLHGRATTAVERSAIRALSRGPATDDGRSTAARPLVRDTGTRTRTVADHLRGTGNRAPHARR